MVKDVEADVKKKVSLTVFTFNLEATWQSRAALSGGSIWNPADLTYTVIYRHMTTYARYMTPYPMPCHMGSYTEYIEVYTFPECLY